VKVIHVLYNDIVFFLAIFLLITSQCFAQNMDDEKKLNVMVEYCAYPVSDRHDSWSLSIYKQNVPFLFSIRTLYHCFSYKGSTHLDIPVDARSGSFFKNFNTTSCDYTKDDSVGLFIFDVYKEDFYVDSLHLPELFGKTYTFHWEIEMGVGVHKQKMSGDHNVYISGFCTDEQSKTIQERKKKREETATLP